MFFWNIRRSFLKPLDFTKRLCIVKWENSSMKVCNRSSLKKCCKHLSSGTLKTFFLWNEQKKNWYNSKNLSCCWQWFRSLSLSLCKPLLIHMWAILRKLNYIISCPYNPTSYLVDLGGKIGNFPILMTYKCSRYQILFKHLFKGFYKMEYTKQFLHKSF